MSCNAGTIGPIEWARAARPAAGELENGDLAVIERTGRGALVAVIDGLGHGERASAAAHDVAAVLRSQADDALTDVLERCHQLCRGGRGAVMSAAQLDAAENTMTWSGIGNVEGLLLRASPTAVRPKESLLLRGGVLGSRGFEPRIATLNVQRGDLLLFWTDGVRPAFLDTIVLCQSVERLAETIHERHARADDDSLVLVIRWLGGGR